MKKITSTYMKRFILPLFLLLTITDCAGAQSVTLPKEVRVKAGRQAIISPKKTSPGAVVNWQVDPSLTDETEEVENLFGIKAKGKVVSSDKAGRFWVKAWVAKDAELPLDRSAVLSILQDKGLSDSQKVESAQAMLSGISVCWVIVGDAPPEPPKPPDPKPPGPKPPEPKPPDPGPGLRVLVVYETGKTYPQKTQSILAGKKVRDYLNAKCADDKGPDSASKKAWRIWDKDTDTSGVAKEWQQLMERVRGKELWLIISRDGVVLHEGPLPSDVDAALELLKKHGG